MGKRLVSVRLTVAEILSLEMDLARSSFGGWMVYGEQTNSKLASGSLAQEINSMAYSSFSLLAEKAGSREASCSSGG